MTARIRFLSCISSATLLLLPNAALYSQSTPDTRITPTLSVTPNLTGVGQPSQVLITIMNQNSACGMQLSPGDSLTVNFDMANGQIKQLPSAVTVTSSTLSATDFLVTQGSPSQIVIQYTGVQANFGFQDSIAINPVLQAPDTVRTNNITLQVPNTERFANSAQNFASWSSADVPFGIVGPQGPAGPSGPMGPAGASIVGPQGAVGQVGPAGPVGPMGPSGQLGAMGQQGPMGPAGPVGPAGAKGATGPAGPQGLSIQGPPGFSIQGAQGVAGPPGMVFRDQWSSGRVYNAADSVTHNGSTYISLVGANTGNQPDVRSDKWSVLALAGAAGPAGPIGLTGAPGAPGAAGAAGAAGPIGPMGLTGAPGAAGPAGPIGPIGPAGVSGLRGPAGPTGPTGPAGASGALLIPVYRSKSFEVPPYQTVSGSARCPAGYIVTGGYQFSQVSASQMFVSQNMPASATEWAVTGYNMNITPAIVTIWYGCTQ